MNGSFGNGKIKKKFHGRITSENLNMRVKLLHHFELNIAIR